MTNYDVFNGDADGICALIQLRLAKPVESQLITGVKRDIQLLEKISAKKNDHITVLDISLNENRKALLDCLDKGAQVSWFDHHFAGEIPKANNLKTYIDTDANICTSLLVDQYLKGQYKAWAVTAAFGDNLKDSAIHAAKNLNLSKNQLDLLEKLGTYINYNGYGSDISELHFSPTQLYSLLLPYANPLDFIISDTTVFKQLESGYKEDLDHAHNIQAEFSSETAAAFILPNEPWARRVSGVYSNELSQNNPDRAHAVLTLKANKNYLVSVRAPLSNKTGADELCRQYPTGGGRKAAAGINELPAHQLDLFINSFRTHFSW